MKVMVARLLWCRWWVCRCGDDVGCWWPWLGWRRWWCGIHDGGGLVEMMMCSGSVVRCGVGWRGGGCGGWPKVGRRRRLAAGKREKNGVGAREWCGGGSGVIEMEMKAVYGSGGSMKVMLARLLWCRWWVCRCGDDVGCVAWDGMEAAVVGGHKLAGGGDWRPEKERKMEWGLGTICPRLPNQEFIVPPSSNLEMISFIKELGYTRRMTNRKMLNSTPYKTYLAFITGVATPKKARKFKKPASPSKKKDLVAIEEPAEKPIKKPAARRQSARSSDEKATKRNKKETDIHQAGASSEGVGLEPEIPDEQKDKSTDTNGDDDDDQESDDEQNVSDNPRTSDDEEETHEDEFVHTPENYVPTNDENVDDEEYGRINKEMYDDVNVELKDVETADEGKGDEGMIDAEKVDAENENVNQEVIGDQVNDDAQATATATLATQKTEVPLQTFHQRLFYLEYEVKTLRNVDHCSAIRATIKSEVSTVVKEYLGTNMDDTVHKTNMEQEDKQQETKYTITSYDTAELQEFDQNRTWFETMTKTQSFNKNIKYNLFLRMKMPWTKVLPSFKFIKLDLPDNALTGREPDRGVEFFEGWKPLSPLQLAVEEVISE
ncbi:hypothetical protein Tco_1006261 [Tanacetum coccineum]|uniref:Uncharacterized protein n=1 Tax=Tanacetum coccineum TaxID=301880 RepID=A0ABQ5FHG8_9ASTR